MTKAEEDFIDQYTRRLLVVWADHTIKGDPLPEMHSIYFDHALAKGWLTKTLPRRLTSTGFATAASFLRR